MKKARKRKKAAVQVKKDVMSCQDGTLQPDPNDDFIPGEDLCTTKNILVTLEPAEVSFPLNADNCLFSVKLAQLSMINNIPPFIGSFSSGTISEDDMLNGVNGNPIAAYKLFTGDGFSSGPVAEGETVPLMLGVFDFFDLERLTNDVCSPEKAETLIANGYPFYVSIDGNEAARGCIQFR